MSKTAVEYQLEFLMKANRLKTAPRTGWALKGVPDCESVADHSHGVALLTLLLLDLVKRPLDRARCLAMAIAHDLPESITGDLSLGASRLLPAGAKAAGEAAAMAELAAGLASSGRWLEDFRRFEEQASDEARLARDADRLDLLLQALTYERSLGTARLDDFWRFAPPDSFHFDASREIAGELHRRRSGEVKVL